MGLIKVKYFYVHDLLSSHDDPNFRLLSDMTIYSCVKRINSIRVHIGKYEYNTRTFQGLLKASPTVFKDLKLMKNTDLNVKNLLQKC